MKTNRIHSIFLGFLLIVGASLFAQNPQLFQMSESTSDPGELALPPVDSLINKAVANSGAYHYFLDELSIREQEMHITRKEWFDFFSVDANVRFGVNDQLYVNQFSFDNAYSQSSSGTQTRFYAGMTAKLPLSTFVNRSNRMRVARLTYKKASEEAEKTRQEIATLIIDKYYQIKLSFKAVVVKYDQLESSKMQMMKAEKEFIDEKIPLSEYAELGQNLFKAQLEYETARNEMLQNISQMEFLTGEKLID